LGHHFLPLVFGNVLHQRLVSLFQFRIPADVLQRPFLESLLAVQFLHVAQNQSAFKPVARHVLDVGPAFGVAFDIGVNLRVDFGDVPIFALFVGTGRCGGPIV